MKAQRPEYYSSTGALLLHIETYIIILAKPNKAHRKQLHRVLQRWAKR